MSLISSLLVETWVQNDNCTVRGKCTFMVVCDSYNSSGGNRVRWGCGDWGSTQHHDIEASESSRHVLAWRNMGPEFLDLQTFKDSLGLQIDIFTYNEIFKCCINIFLFWDWEDQVQFTYKYIWKSASTVSELSLISYFEGNMVLEHFPARI